MKSRPADSTDGSVLIPLEEVVITDQLARRPARTPDYQAETRAIAELMQSLATFLAAGAQESDISKTLPQILQQLAELAMRLCRAHSSGISILEKADGEEVFRWHAASGLWSQFSGQSMSRQSPCGVVLDQNAALLMSNPERHFLYQTDDTPPLVETLLVPFHYAGEPVGTVWIIAHDASRQFDSEDLRVLTSLSHIAALVYQAFDQHRLHLARENADSLRLHHLYADLIHEDDPQVVFDKIVDAAASVMRSEFACIQAFCSEQTEGEGGLRLLAYRGFSPEVVRLGTWIRDDEHSTCAAALQSHQRVVVPDIDRCEFLVGTQTQSLLQTIGVRAMQTTPLVSRSGKLLGMLSTHWREPRSLSQGDLRLLDVLARQAADLIERRETIESLRISEAQLRKSEQSLRTLIDNLPGAAAFVVDRDLRFRWAGGGAMGAAGISPATLIGKTIFEVLEPHLVSQYEPRYRQALAGTPFEVEHDAHGRSFISRGVPLRDQAGEIYAVLAFSHDITERTRAEEALRESEERQAFLLKLSDVLRSLSDPQEIHAQACQLLGEHLRVNRCGYADVDGDMLVIQRSYARDVVPWTGRFSLARFGEEFLTAHRAGETIVVAELRASPWLSEYGKATLASGDVAAFVAVTLIKHDQRVGIFGVQSTTPRQWTEAEVELVREVGDRIWTAAERARAAAALRDSSERLRLALDASTTGTFIWHVEPDVAECDANMLALFGLPPGASMTLKNALATMIHPGDVTRYAAAVARACTPETNGQLREDIRVNLPDGTKRWLAITGQVYFDEEPRRAKRMAGACVDITARKQMEDVLREADRRKDEFLATLAHELRNPLAPIRSSIQVLQMSARNDATIARVSEMMERQVNHMVRLVDDLLEVSRITRGAIELRREHTDLAAIVGSAVDASTPLIESRQHRLAIAIPPEPVPIFGDGVRLAQVLSNLLNNAAKYTDQAGEIQLSAEVTGPEVAISVRDNGIGIAREQLSLVFEMFMQVDRTTERAQGGLGIGLTLAKSLIEMHGGTISVHSGGIGQGSEFVVRLPIDAAQQAPIEPVQATDTRLPHHQLLVVDDNQDAAFSLAMLVKVLGSDVQIANDGPTALAMIASYQPDMILLDIGMPDMDGFEVAKRIRQRRDCDHIMLVALTGWGQQSDRERTREAGFDLHLVKPAGMSELQQLLGSQGRGRAVADDALS